MTYLLLRLKLVDVLILVVSMRWQLLGSMVGQLESETPWLLFIQCFLLVWTGETGELGKVVMRVPAKRVIDVVLKIIECYKEEKNGKEILHEWIHKISIGKVMEDQDFGRYQNYTSPSCQIAFF